MSARRESQRTTKLKHDREETPDTLVPAKRHRKESGLQGLNTAPTMSAPATNVNVGVHDALLRVYHHMLPKNPEGIAFLFDARFAEALRVPANRVAIEYQITREEGIEELRRLIAIKAFTVDKDATKISPTPLST